jgi:hypothetical protein
MSGQCMDTEIIHIESLSTTVASTHLVGDRLPQCAALRCALAVVARAVYFQALDAGVSRHQLGV